MEASPAQHPPHGTFGTARSGAAPSARRSISAIGIAANRRCSRAACGEPATATLVFSYDEQVARVVGLVDEAEPQTYDLCGTHADRTSPPLGWELADTRPPPGDQPRRLEDEDTVAVIAAALRGDDTPRRVDVIEGGEGADVTPRRVTSTGLAPSPVAPPPVPPGATGDDDPLRAALEEVQRVVVPDTVDEAAPTPAIPLAQRRLRDLPPPPAMPPPGPPPATAADDRSGRPTLW